jgi:hypothetical protein
MFLDFSFIENILCMPLGGDIADTRIQNQAMHEEEGERKLLFCSRNVWQKIVVAK